MTSPREKSLQGFSFFFANISPLLMKGWCKTIMKFFYALGVYTFCIGVHNALEYIGSDRFRDALSELSDEVDRIKSGEKKKEEDCKGAVVAKVVRHRIGF